MQNQTQTEIPSTPSSIISDSNTDKTSSYTASQWQLMWWKFRKHRIAVWSATVLLVLYLAAVFCEFLAPYSLSFQDTSYNYAPPQRLHFTSESGFHLWPFVYGLKGQRNPETLQKSYQEDLTQKYPIRLLAKGQTYKFWGLFKMDRHLIGVDSGGTLFLLGTDSMGRDLLSRIIYGSRISLTIGLLGVSLSFFLGLSIGAISGYFGGWVDDLIQRMIEILRSFPQIPLWLALSAALPSSWSALQIYLGITIVLSIIGWTGLARQVRSKILSLREEDFATAALLVGASQTRIMWHHLLPSFMSHIIVSLTLAIPAMIIGETSLSFLGLGLRPPITSWGVLLKEAQNMRTIAFYPWLLSPAVFVILTVLVFNFMGDGLRDAADPYER